jgi:hypothetical protein
MNFARGEYGIECIVDSGFAYNNNNRLQAATLADIASSTVG